MTKIFRYFIILLSFSTLLTQPVLAANHQPTSLVGNDISYPQCGSAYPTGQAFGIVGINNGLANTTNPCLGSELSWASKSLGGTSQALEQVYVNTANPGGLGTKSWPTSNLDPSGQVAPNPYGNCDGSNSIACSWQYGWNRAVEDVQSRFIPAAQSAGISTNPAQYPWWLDVETANSWESNQQFNAADLEGMVAYISSQGAKVGIYSTSSQWNQIVGTTSPNNLHGLLNWLPGAHRLSSAKSDCTQPAFSPGGKVTITQYTSGTFDYDYSCI